MLSFVYTSPWIQVEKTHLSVSDQVGVAEFALPVTGDL